MITLEYVKEYYPKSSDLLALFVLEKCGGNYSHSSIIYFLDTHKLWIGITVGDSGQDYVVELNGLLLNCLSGRIKAEEWIINEALLILEKTI